MKPFFVVLLSAPVLFAAGSMNCDLSGYRSQRGLEASLHGDALEVIWQG